MSAITVTVGHTVNCSLVFLDQNGNPMITAPAPDAPPVWANTTPATATLVADAAGLAAAETAVAAGSDTVNVTVLVGGVSFAASLEVTVESVAQVFTSVQIVANVAS